MAATTNLEDLKKALDSKKLYNVAGLDRDVEIDAKDFNGIQDSTQSAANIIGVGNYSVYGENGQDLLLRINGHDFVVKNYFAQNGKSQFKWVVGNEYVEGNLRAAQFDSAVLANENLYDAYNFEHKYDGASKLTGTAFADTFNLTGVEEAPGKKGAGFTLDGKEGNDTFTGSTFADTITGGTGINTVELALDQNAVSGVDTYKFTKNETLKIHVTQVVPGQYEVVPSENGKSIEINTYGVSTYGYGKFKITSSTAVEGGYKIVAKLYAGKQSGAYEAQFVDVEFVNDNDLTADANLYGAYQQGSKAILAYPVLAVGDTDDGLAGVKENIGTITGATQLDKENVLGGLILDNLAKQNIAQAVQIGVNGGLYNPLTVNWTKEDVAAKGKLTASAINDNVDVHDFVFEGADSVLSGLTINTGLGNDDIIGSSKSDTINAGLGMDTFTTKDDATVFGDDVINLTKNENLEINAAANTGLISEVVKNDVVATGYNKTVLRYAKNETDFAAAKAYKTYTKVVTDAQTVKTTGVYEIKVLTLDGANVATASYWNGEGYTNLTVAQVTALNAAKGTLDLTFNADKSYRLVYNGTAFTNLLSDKAGITEPAAGDRVAQGDYYVADVHTYGTVGNTNVWDAAVNTKLFSATAVEASTEVTATLAGNIGGDLVEEVEIAVDENYVPTDADKQFYLRRDTVNALNNAKNAYEVTIDSATEFSASENNTAVDATYSVIYLDTAAADGTGNIVKTDDLAGAPAAADLVAQTNAFGTYAVGESLGTVTVKNAAKAGTIGTGSLEIDNLSIYGTAFNTSSDSITASAKKGAKITGTAVGDIIDGSKATSITAGGKGLNIDGGFGADSIVGTAGNDTYSAGLSSYENTKNQIVIDVTNAFGDDVVKTVKGEATNIVFKGDVVNNQIKVTNNGKDVVITAQKATASADVYKKVNTAVAGEAVAAEDKTIYLVEKNGVAVTVYKKVGAGAWAAGELPTTIPAPTTDGNYGYIVVGDAPAVVYNTVTGGDTDARKATLVAKTIKEVTTTTNVYSWNVAGQTGVAGADDVVTTYADSESLPTVGPKYYKNDTAYVDGETTALAQFNAAVADVNNFYSLKEVAGTVTVQGLASKDGVTDATIANSGIYIKSDAPQPYNAVTNLTNIDYVSSITKADSITAVKGTYLNDKVLVGYNEDLTAGDAVDKKLNINLAGGENTVYLNTKADTKGTQVTATPATTATVNVVDEKLGKGNETYKLGAGINTLRFDSTTTAGNDTITVTKGETFNLSNARTGGNEAYNTYSYKYSDNGKDVIVTAFDDNNNGSEGANADDDATSTFTFANLASKNPDATITTTGGDGAGRIGDTAASVKLQAIADEKKQTFKGTWLNDSITAKSGYTATLGAGYNKIEYNSTTTAAGDSTIVLTKGENLTIDETTDSANKTYSLEYGKTSKDVKLVATDTKGTVDTADDIVTSFTFTGLGSKDPGATVTLSETPGLDNANLYLNSVQAFSTGKKNKGEGYDYTGTWLNDSVRGGEHNDTYKLGASVTENRIEQDVTKAIGDDVVTLTKNEVVNTVFDGAIGGQVIYRKVNNDIVATVAGQTLIAKYTDNAITGTAKVITKNTLVETVIFEAGHSHSRTYNNETGAWGDWSDPVAAVGEVGTTTYKATIGGAADTALDKAGAEVYLANATNADTFTIYANAATATDYNWVEGTKTYTAQAPVDGATTYSIHNLNGQHVYTYTLDNTAKTVVQIDALPGDINTAIAAQTKGINFTDDGIFGTVTYKNLGKDMEGSEVRVNGANIWNQDILINATSAKTTGTYGDDIITSDKAKNTFVETYSANYDFGDNDIYSTKGATDVIQVAVTGKNVDKKGTAFDFDYAYAGNTLSIDGPVGDITYTALDSNGDAADNLANVSFQDATNKKYQFRNFEAVTTGTATVDLSGKDTSKTNNIVFAENNTVATTITDSKMNDIIYGSDVATTWNYTAGSDLYVGGTAADTYNVAFGKKTDVVIADDLLTGTSVADTLVINADSASKVTSLNDLMLFFNVNDAGNIKGTTLSILQESAYKTAAAMLSVESGKLSGGLIEIEAYFDGGDNHGNAGKGRIETIKLGNTAVNVAGKVEAVRAAVTAWLTSNGNYDNVQAVLDGGNKQDIQSLLNVYATTEAPAMG